MICSRGCSIPSDKVGLGSETLTDGIRVDVADMTKLAGACIAVT